MDHTQAAAINAAIRTIGMRHRTLAGAKLAEIGLSLGQEMLIVELSRRGSRTQAQLAEAACCEPPTITSAVQKMEANGLVERSPSPCDRRAMVVELTDKGRAAVSELEAVWLALAEETVAGLRRTELDPLIDALNDLAEGLTRS
ncbi:MarR family winged helix-turn-helix transcriptional regulator [Arthrobacter sp. H5]|uniref:MarR family winged helix-turn-helix transcriptional regulator n=1 Tax=Arthrobacter sp. H5 TaxID=1267973 RepID=UPI000489EBF3|nr:MarR family winged helix-turn-helix transcriptional regulator [Arthrobacter sp. H5]